MLASTTGSRTIPRGGDRHTVADGRDAERSERPGLPGWDMHPPQRLRPVVPGDLVKQAWNRRSVSCLALRYSTRWARTGLRARSPADGPRKGDTHQSTV